jgi:hypothetical protein
VSWLRRRACAAATFLTSDPAWPPRVRELTAHLQHSRKQSLPTFSGGSPGRCIMLRRPDTDPVLLLISAGVVPVAGKCSHGQHEIGGSQGASVHGEAAVRGAVLDGAG